MVKKLKSLSKNEDKKLAGSVRDSAQQIWQAGLGAFSKAQEEGSKVFSKLVKEGSELQRRTKEMAGGGIAGMQETVGKVAGGARKQATGSWDKLEHVFEERVARTLASMGVPTQKDIQLLTKRIEELSAAVEQLSSGKADKAGADAGGPVGSGAKPAAKPRVRTPAKAKAAAVSAVADGVADGGVEAAAKPARAPRRRPSADAANKVAAADAE